MKLTKDYLKQRQSLPLSAKIEVTKKRIRQWYNYWNGEVYVAFSGGKDSTVLLDLVRSIYPNVPAVFVDTGLEYPEIKEFVKTFDNIMVLRPEMNFTQVIKEYGYPVVSKKVAKMVRVINNPTDKNKKSRKLFLEGIDQYGNPTTMFKLPKKWRKLIDAPFKVSEKCCDIMKKKPMHKYNKETKKRAYVGMMAQDSQLREKNYLSAGCNNYNGNELSTPLGFWIDEDIWEYIKLKKLKYCNVYDTGVKRTGCVFCMFGVHMEKGLNRFQLMEKSHPQLHSYCINKLGLGKILDYINVEYTNKQKCLIG